MRVNNAFVLDIQERQQHMWVNLDYPYKQGKALSEVARGTMSQVLIYKTRIVSGYGELIADTITR